MDLTGNELLPRSRLALNQHRRSSRCGALDLLALVAHSRGVADELVLALFFFAQLIDLFLEFLRAHRIAHGEQELVAIERLLEKVERAALRALDRRLNVG